eukprot:179562_1
MISKIRTIRTLIFWLNCYYQIRLRYLECINVALISRNHEVKQYCYKYDDFKSCYCKPNDDANATQLLYCAEWVCHQYMNKAKNSLSFDADYDASKAGTYHNYWNASDRAPPSDVNVSSVIDETVSQNNA